MHVGVEAGAGVFGDDEGVVVLPGFTGCGFNAHVGGDAAENDGGDIAAA